MNIPLIIANFFLTASLKKLPIINKITLGAYHNYVSYCSVGKTKQNSDWGSAGCTLQRKSKRALFPEAEMARWT